MKMCQDTEHAKKLSAGMGHVEHLPKEAWFCWKCRRNSDPLVRTGNIDYDISGDKSFAPAASTHAVPRRPNLKALKDSV